MGEVEVVSLIQILGSLLKVNFFVCLFAIYIFLCELSVLHLNVDFFKKHICHSKREILGRLGAQ